jgi:serine/threonine protein kinase
MYPSKLQYKNAVNNCTYPVEENGGYTFEPFFRDNDIVSSSGGQAIVFKVVDPDDKLFALKLFNTEVEDRFNRLKIIADYIEGRKNRFFIPFKFIERLIYVDVTGLSEDQKFFPGIVMEWIEAPTLEEKIKTLINSNDLVSIQKIAENFKDLSKSLLNLNIAHGDLKLSNILINDQLYLYLIDYDGMFVPKLKGKNSNENGTLSYQHPKRALSDFNERIDEFSILNIYSSLLLLAHLPSLYQKFNDGDNILFTQEDFLNPSESALFKIEIDDEYLKGLIYYLKQALYAETIYIDNIHDLLEGKFPVPEINISCNQENIFIGDILEVQWSTQNCSIVKINGNNCKTEGSLEIFITNDFLVIEIGNELTSKNFRYSLNVLIKPEIKYFKADSNFVTTENPINLFWDVSNFDRLSLTYDSHEYDVTNLHSFNITKLSKSEIIKLKAYPKGSDRYVDSIVNIEVFFPIELRVKQDKRIVYRNQLLTLNLDITNAQEVRLMPLNVDLTGLLEYSFRPNANTNFTIVAKNKFFSKSYNSFVEVIAPPEYSKKLISLPKIELKLPLLIINRTTLDYKISTNKRMGTFLKGYLSIFKKIKLIRIKKR